MNREEIDAKVFLNGEWWNLCVGLGVKNKVLIREKFNALCQNYSAPKRYYHAPSHLVRCFEEFQPVESLCHNPLAIKFALFGHDMFYDVTRKDNEVRSAIWTRTTILELGLSEDFAFRVYGFILLTEHKKLPSVDLDAQFLVDIDLSSLGSSPEVFNRNTADICREYVEGLGITAEAFHVRRIGFIEDLLDKGRRPYIYSTDYFREKYELRALENLKRSLAILRKE